MTFRTRWIGFIYQVATGNKKVRTFLTPMVGLFFVFLVTSFVIVSLLIDHWLNFPKLIPFHLILSLPVISLGVFLILWCQIIFFKKKGTPVPLDPPPQLIITGPYAYIRNPMLSGIFILLFGLGLAFNSFSLIFIFTPLFILMNIAEIKAIEEPELEMRLGQDYLEYKKKTPMFFPKIW